MKSEELWQSAGDVVKRKGYLGWKNHCWWRSRDFTTLNISLTLTFGIYTFLLSVEGKTKRLLLLSCISDWYWAGRGLGSGPKMALVMCPAFDSPLFSTTTGCHHRPWVQLPGKGNGNLTDMSLRSFLFTEPTLQTFSLNYKPREEKWSFFSHPPQLSSWSCKWNERKKTIWQWLLWFYCQHARQGICSKPCPCQHLAFFAIQPRVQNAKALWAHALSYSCTRLGVKRVKGIHACLCSRVIKLVYTQSGCSSCMSEGTENARWGGLDVVFQSEWPTEENNKAPMTGTDGLLYCPLKCKQWISLLGVWLYYIFIFSLLSLSLLIALVAGTHPHLRLKCLIKGWSQMLIIGCLQFNGQKHRSKMIKGGTTVQAGGWESTTVRTQNVLKATVQDHCTYTSTLSNISPCLQPKLLYLLTKQWVQTMLSKTLQLTVGYIFYDAGIVNGKKKKRNFTKHVLSFNKRFPLYSFQFTTRRVWGCYIVIKRILT